ncbi:response regulator transcription factor [Spirosoma daeguense]
MKLLLVEDEPDLLKAMQSFLESEKYVVTATSTYAQASRAIHDYDYDCIVVDIGLPDGNGLNLIQQVRTTQQQSQSNATSISGSAASEIATPGLIIISAKNSLDDKLMGLELGSDDYLTKPFHLPELNARIKSVLRRRSFNGHLQLTAGVIGINTQAHSVSVQGNRVELTEKEYQLLLFFIANVNRLLTKSAIAESVWGDYMDGADSHEFLYTHIRNLRRKLMDQGCPDYIKTRYGAGYIFSTLA